jgi:hypothetical protein
MPGSNAVLPHSATGLHGKTARQDPIDPECSQPGCPQLSAPPVLYPETTVPSFRRAESRQNSWANIMAKMDPPPDLKWSGQTKAEQDRADGDPAGSDRRGEAGKGRRANPAQSDEGGLNPGQKGPAQPSGTDDAT